MADETETEVQPIIRTQNPAETPAVSVSGQKISLADRLFGPALAWLKRQPSVPTQPEITEQPDNRPEWIKREEKRLQPLAAQTAYNQTLERGFPEPGPAVPSVEGTGSSPFDAAAKLGMLPPKEVDSLEIQAGKQAMEAQAQQVKESQQYDLLVRSLDKEAKTPK